uniref:Uncharacterized protein n=1 Tax=Oryza barthii TaxID=65489 RepID=A0A0D3HCQ7_9ORYZ
MGVRGLNSSQMSKIHQFYR